MNAIRRGSPQGLTARPSGDASAVAGTSPHAVDYSYDEYISYEDTPPQIETYYVGENGH